MSGPPGAAGRPPRIPDHVRFEDEREYESDDPLDTGLHHLPTLDHNSPMIAQQVVAVETTFPRVGRGSAAAAPATERPSRLVKSQAARDAEEARRRARSDRFWGRVELTAKWLIVGAMVGLAAYVGTRALLGPEGPVSAQDYSNGLVAIAMVNLLAALMLVLREGRRRK